MCQKYLQLNEIKTRISEGKDVIGRKDNFVKIKIDKSYPDYILNNEEVLKDWIE